MKVCLKGVIGSNMQVLCMKLRPAGEKDNIWGSIRGQPITEAVIINCGAVFGKLYCVHVKEIEMLGRETYARRVSF